MREEQIEQLVRDFRDPALGRALQPWDEWSLVEGMGRLVLLHRSEARVVHYLHIVRWNAWDRWGTQLRGERGGYRDFRYPSRAIAALREAGELAPREVVHDG